MLTNTLLIPKEVSLFFQTSFLNRSLNKYWIISNDYFTEDEGDNQISLDLLRTREGIFL